MALIKCIECNKEISDKAAACPGCGAPLGKNHRTPAAVTRSGAKWEGIGFLLILAGWATAISTGQDNKVGGAIVAIGFVVFIIGRFK